MICIMKTVFICIGVFCFVMLAAFAPAIDDFLAIKVKQKKVNETLVDILPLVVQLIILIVIIGWAIKLSKICH